MSTTEKPQERCTDDENVYYNLDLVSKCCSFHFFSSLSRPLLCSLLGELCLFVCLGFVCALSFFPSVFLSFLGVSSSFSICSCWFFAGFFSLISFAWFLALLDQNVILI